MEFIKRHWVFYLMVVSAFISAAMVSSHLCTQFVAASAEEAEPVVVIDAGHGGQDGGAVSCTGVLESTVNLAVSKRLDAILQLLGAKTVMLRSEDKSLHTQGDTIASQKVSDLKNRISMVNGEANPILVSIHQNHFTESRYSGAQVFFASTEGSQELAELAQESLRLALDPKNNRTCKKADGIYLMEHITCPGILVECGFLSNPAEEKKLQEAPYQMRIAAALAAALGQYRSAETA